MAGVTGACLLVLLNVLGATSRPEKPQETLDDEARVENVGSYGDYEPVNDTREEMSFPPPFPGGPGGPAWGPNSEQLKMLRKRLTVLKAKYDALNETEKEAIRERAKAYHQKMMEEREQMMAEMPPPPPMDMCPPCPCMEEGYEVEDEEEEPVPPPMYVPHHYPRQRYPPPPRWGRYRQPYGPPPGYSRPMEAEAQPKSRSRRNAYMGHGHMGRHHHAPRHHHIPQHHHHMGHNHNWGHNANNVWADLVQTFNVEDDMEWWFKDNMGEEDEVSKSLRGWDPAYATHKQMMKQMDQHGFALHIGGINTGDYLHPERYDPGRRMFGSGSDFHAQDMHAFAKTPHGQFSLSNWADWIKWSSGETPLPANAAYIYQPNPNLLSIQGITLEAEEDVKNVFTSANLDTGRQKNLPPGTYSLKWLQRVWPKDASGNEVTTGNPAGFNVVLRDTTYGRFYGVQHIDLSQLQDATSHSVTGRMYDTPWQMPFSWGDSTDRGKLVYAPPVRHYGDYGGNHNNYHAWHNRFPDYFPSHEAWRSQYPSGEGAYYLHNHPYSHNFE